MGASLTARRSTEVMADGTQISTRGRLSRDTPHRWRSSRMSLLGYVEIGDGPLAKWPYCHDVTGRAADHLPGLLTNGQDLLGPCVQGDHGRLVEDDPPTSGVHECVGRAKVDGEIPSHVLQLPLGHRRGPS